MTKRLASLFTLLCLPLALLAQSSKPEDSIHADALRAHMRFLSDDLLEGRGTGTRGHLIAARYVASQFEGMGLKPGGDGGTYYQGVRLRQANLVKDQSSYAVGKPGAEQDQTYETGWLSGGDYLRTDTSAEGPIVFVGFGIEAPELKHDDYAGVDVKGKIVAVFPGAPATWESTVRAYYSSNFLKSKTAAEHGAIGTIALWNPDYQVRAPWERLVRQFRMPLFKALDPNGQPADTYQQLRAGVIVPLEKAKEMISSAGKDFDEVWKETQADKHVSMELPLSAKMHLVSEQKDIVDPNVVGVLPGSDPKLKDEYVVFTAHLDHLGIGTPVKGDNIYNGAFDNAAGSAALMEIARAFASMPKGPRRTLIFVNVTGEEKGLLGSQYYSLNPTVPIGQIVANINMDELGSLYPLKDVVAIGGEHSSLNNDFQAAARQLGFEVSPDPFPEETVFIRSDQFPFVRTGIPALFVIPGLQSSDPKIDGKAVFQNWLKNLYHSPQDEITLPFDWPSHERLAKLDFLIGQRVANATERPTWNKGDIFQKKFGGPEAK